MRAGTHTLLALASLFCMTAKAQIAEKSIGANFYAGLPSGYLIVYDDKVAEKGVMEYKAGFAAGNNLREYKLGGNYHFMFPNDIRFNFFIGPGVSAGYWKTLNNHEEIQNSGVFMNLNLDGGCEYYFPFPLKIALTVTPEVGIIDDNTGYAFSGGLTFSYYIP